MTTNDIKKAVVTFVDKYSIKSIVLFGSRAAGTNTANSDVDLIVEFFIDNGVYDLSVINEALYDHGEPLLAQPA